MIGAVDIGGTKVAVGVVDNDGKVLSSQESPTGSDCEYAYGLDMIVSMLKDAAAKSRRSSFLAWGSVPPGRSIHLPETLARLIFFRNGVAKVW